jgi:8-oxo-dGTP pyrophosphatase MutT (NUDIX family)
MADRELAALMARYGAPQHMHAVLERVDVAPFDASDRVGEVCMVIRRPTGQLITARKRYYPADAVRLLTGGVGHGEPIEHALLREVDEETGLEVLVRRFLAQITYAPRAEPERVCFTTYALLLDEVGGTLAPRDPAEQIDSYGLIWPAGLPTLAAALEQLPDRVGDDIRGSWRTWGAFRAVVHRVVHQALTSGGG